MSRSRSPRHIDDLISHRDRGRQQPEAQQRPDLRTQLIASGLLAPGDSSTDNLAGPPTRKPGAVASTSSPCPAAVPGPTSGGEG